MATKRGYFGEEQVDFDLLRTFIDDLKSGRSSDELIDRFLELKDFRIPMDDSSEEVAEPMNLERCAHLDDDIASEELAKIYKNQGKYLESKEIYTKLFLLYSEKIAYFATQIESLDMMLTQEGGADKAEKEA